MNKSQRAVLGKLVDRFTLAQLDSLCEELKDELETLRDDEQEKLDNMPDGLRNGEKGEAMEEGVNLLNEALEHLDSIVDASGSFAAAMDSLTCS